MTPPELIVPVSTGAEATSASGAIVTFDPPSATDIGTVSLGCTAMPGDQFPIGTTTVTCTATDDANLSTVGMFDVTVSDTTTPLITSVADINAEANTTGGANVAFTKPTATDFGLPVEVTLRCTDPNGAFYPFGTTMVTCTTEPDAGGA